MSSVSVNANVNPQRTRRSRSAEPTKTLLLQEARGLPIFWSGTEAVSKLAYRVPTSDAKLDTMTIAEVLEKFSSQNYLRNCTISLAVSSENARAFAMLRMSDNFATLWNTLEKKRTVKLILEISSDADVPNEICTKYLLILSEMNKKRVFWDGRRPVFSTIAKIAEAQMLTTFDTFLRKYLSLDYLRNKGTVLQIVLSKTKKGDEKVREVNLRDTLGSIFSGGSASLRICILPTASEESESEIEVSDINSNKSSEQSVKDVEDIDPLSIASFWFQNNWPEIREKVGCLLEALELLRIERELSSHYSTRLTSGKQRLETAMRRRNRNMDEIWGCYELLKSDVDSAVRQFPYKSNLSSSNVQNFQEPAPPSDSVLAVSRIDIQQTTVSCIDMVAHAFRRMGVEILDHDQRISPAAGVAITMGVIVVVCVLSHIVSA